MSDWVSESAVRNGVIRGRTVHGPDLDLVAWLEVAGLDEAGEQYIALGNGRNVGPNGGRKHQSERDEIQMGHRVKTTAHHSTSHRGREGRWGGAFLINCITWHRSTAYHVDGLIRLYDRAEHREVWVCHRVFNHRLRAVLEDCIEERLQGEDRHGEQVARAGGRA